MNKLLLTGAALLVLLLFDATSLRNIKVAFSNRSKEEINMMLAFQKQNSIACTPALYKPIFFNNAEEIYTNDNRHPAGQLHNGILYINLEVRTGNWYPETHDGKPIRVHAFAEAGKPLQLPGPLIRVPEGTEIRAKIRNLIVDAPLVLHGFNSRPGTKKDSISIFYGQTYAASFKAGAAGTYFYWATAGNLKVDGLPYFTDSQLYGAFIIDSINAKPDTTERILMIGIWNDTLVINHLSNEELVLNGLTWPYTERLGYRVNQKVQWRVINASNQAHPMHLHGFYYMVNSRGNAYIDQIYNQKDQRRSVTELLHPHQTMALTWIPEKEGNWLFHCHTLVHIMPFSFLRKKPAMDEQHMNDVTNHARDGMGGLMMGIHVQSLKQGVKVLDPRKIRALTLIAQEQPNHFDTLPGKGFVLLEGDTSSASKRINIPGPPIILSRDEPVAITIINKLRDPTTIHWHGLEIESYFDGAAGWGNTPNKLAPLILPGTSFTAHLTPPRAGTFIYHTHMHDEQLIAGMYGPLIVMEKGQTFDPETNKIFLISSGPILEPPVALLNGSDKPETMHLKMGRKYRFRLINITALGPTISVSFLYKGNTVNWLAIAKDGADFPPQQVIMKPAAAQSITIGETRDFEFRPQKKGDYLFGVLDESGKVLVQMTIQVN